MSNFYNKQQSSGLAPNGDGSQLTGITKTQVGLGNVDNTSDANKPVSTAQQTALDAKSNLKPTAATYAPATGSQTVALDVTSGNMHFVTGHADGTAITFTITGATNNQPFIVSVTQGSGTVSTIAGWFATVRWTGGSTPTLTATLNKRDVFGFIRTGANTYDGFVIGQNI